MGKNKISKKEKQRLEAQAQAKAKRKESWSFMIMCVGLVAIMWLAGYLLNGAELADRPTKRQVVSVEATNIRHTDEAVIYDSKEGVELSCIALEMVRVRFKDYEGEFDPYLTLTFHMNDGSEKVLQIADGAAKWNGLVRPLAREEKMLEVMDAVFFPSYVEADEK